MRIVLTILVAATSLTACSSSHASAPTAPAPVVTPGASYVLTGTVSTNTDAGTRPLDDVSIELSNGTVGRSAVSDQDGRFEIDGLSAGTWTISLSKDGYATRSQAVDIAGNTIVDFALSSSDQPPSPTRPEPVKRRS